MAGVEVSVRFTETSVSMLGVMIIGLSDGALSSRVSMSERWLVTSVVGSEAIKVANRIVKGKTRLTIRK